LEYSKIVDSFLDILTEMLTMIQGNVGIEKLKDIIVKKRLEIIAIHKEILKNNEEYNNTFKRLSIEKAQDNEYLETEFNKTSTNPYETLKEYYKLTIEELKAQIEELKSGKGEKRQIVKISQEINNKEELEKLMENNHVMVRYSNV